MRAIPRWFKRELKLLDPTYRIAYNQAIDKFLILKDVGYYFYVDGTHRHQKETLIRAGFKNLDRVAMTSLKRRKWLGRKWMARGDDMAYQKHLDREEAEKKAKVSDKNIDQITAGIMTAHKLSTTKTFS